MKRFFLIAGLVGVAVIIVGIYGIPHYKMKTIYKELQTLFTDHISADFKVSDRAINKTSIRWDDVTFDEDGFISAQDVTWNLSEDKKSVTIDGLNLVLSSKDGIEAGDLFNRLAGYIEHIKSAAIQSANFPNFSATLLTENFGDVGVNSDITFTPNEDGAYVAEGHFKINSPVLKLDLKIYAHVLKDNFGANIEIAPSDIRHPKFKANRFLAVLAYSKTEDLGLYLHGGAMASSAQILGLPFGNVELKLKEESGFSLTGNAIDTQDILFTFNSNTQKGTLTASNPSALLEFLSRSKYDLLAPQDVKNISQTSKPKIKFQLSSDMKRLGYAYEDPVMKTTIQRMVILSDD
jgi:hypothetical protein